MWWLFLIGLIGLALLITMIFIIVVTFMDEPVAGVFFGVIIFWIILAIGLIGIGFFGWGV